MIPEYLRLIIQHMDIVWFLHFPVQNKLQVICREQGGEYVFVDTSGRGTISIWGDRPPLEHYVGEAGIFCKPLGVFDDTHTGL